MHRAFKAGDLTFLIVALALMIVLSAILAFVAPPNASNQRGSSFSAGGSGAKAAFLLLKQLGYNVERSFEPIYALKVEPAGTVLVLASPIRRASRQDLRALKDFIEGGGVVFTTGGGGSFLP